VTKLPVTVGTLEKKRSDSIVESGELSKRDQTFCGGGGGAKKSFRHPWKRKVCRKSFGKKGGKAGNHLTLS